MAFLASLFALLTSRWLGPDGRGGVVLFLTTASLLMLIGSGGVATSVRVLLHAPNALDLETYATCTRTLLAIHVATSAILGSCILRITGSTTEPITYGLFPVYACLLLYSYFRREALYGLGHIDKAMFSDIVPVVTQLLGALGLEVTGHMHEEGVLGVITVGGILQALYLRLLTPKRRRLATDGAWDLQALLRYGMPAIAVALGQAFALRGDRLILGVLSERGQVGVYGAAATLTELLGLLPAAMGQVILHRVSLHKTHSATIRRGIITMLVTSGGAAVLIVSAGWIVPVLLGDEFLGAVPLIRVLAIAAVPLSWYYVNVSVLIGLGRLRSAGTATALGAVVLLLACVVLVPPMHAAGAAWASVASYTALGIVSWRSLRAVPLRPLAVENG